MRSAFFILISCFLTATAFSQFTAKMEAWPKRLTTDDHFTLNISVTGTGAVSHISTPSFSDFIILEGPIYGKRIVTTHGVTTHTTDISFILKPKSSGSIRIDPAIIKAGNESLKTNPVTITVSKRKNTLLSPQKDSRPAFEYSDIVLKQGEDIAKKVEKNLIPVLEISRASCYVGEPVMAEYKLYSRLRSNSRLIKIPSFNGFSVIDITPSDQFLPGRESLNGKAYNVYSIRKAQLYPLQPGTFTLEAAEFQNNIEFVKEEDIQQLKNAISANEDLRDALPDDAFVYQNLNLKSNPATIHVMPLPEEGKPDSFKGMVGDFRINTSLERNRFGINESEKLSIRIQGKGNLQMLTPPEIKWPEGLDALQPVASETITKDSFPISGTKRFDIEFTASHKGEFHIPQIAFSFFNPQSKSYKTIETEPLTLTVSDAVPIATPTQSETKRSASTGINRITETRWPVVAILALAILSGLLIWVRRDKKKKSSHSINEAIEVLPDEDIQVIVNPLSKSELLLTQRENQAFYATLLNEYKQFLSAKFQIPIQQINGSSIQEKLDQFSIPNPESVHISQLISMIEGRVYTPVSNGDNKTEMYEQVLAIINRLKSREIRHP